MKTQISRNSHQPKKGYNGVYQQQGRMLTDADWNELTDIQKQRLVAALKDAIASGAPREQGLKINTDGTLQPGILYVDGWLAQLDAPTPLSVIEQPDYPSPPTFSGKNLRLYADVWERSVTALEDDALMDSALHGADTCTRTSTMLQVKWCSTSKHPDNPTENPPIGSGELKLKLRNVSLANDPCDPCASQLDLDQRVGNYLFRVEVHDHYIQSGKEYLVLKWSRDNGSEQYATNPIAELPQGFTSGDWIWEFFDLDCEKLLGRHYPQSYKPRRGELVTSFTVPSGSKPKDFVRQWDGYCKLNLTDDLLLEGMDRGVALDTALGAQAQGYVALNGGNLKLNLELMELELRYTGKQFLAGDYWQSAVREAVDKVGDYILGDALQDGVTPAGIFHHYLLLGQLDSAGALVPLTDAEQRQFNFPPLTDIHAADVGFTDNCPGLFDGAENVQQALDNLCSIGAEDIDYQPSDCPESVESLLKDAVPGWPDLDSDGKNSVKDMLDALLCQLNAGTLPYTVPDCGDDDAPSVRSLIALPSGFSDTASAIDALLCNLDAASIPLNKDESICTELDVSDVQTVQDALQRLCLKSGGGCVVSVFPGELETRLEAFAASDDETIWLCLQPGSHVIGKTLTITGKQSIKITGAGEQTSIIQLNTSQLNLEAKEIHLEDIGMTFSEASGYLKISTDRISAVHNYFHRSGSTSDMPPMIVLSILGADEGQIHWSNNHLSSAWQHLAPGAVVDELAPVGIVGATVNEGLKELLSDETLMFDNNAYKAAVDKLAKEVVSLPPTTRTAWKSAALGGLGGVEYALIDTSSFSRVRTPTLFAIRQPTASDTTATMDTSTRAQAAMDAMTMADVTMESVADNIDIITSLLLVTGYNPVLAIASHNMGGRLEGNSLAGELWLLNSAGKRVDPATQALNDVAVEGDRVSVGADLHIHNNEIQKVISFMESGLVNSGVLINPVAGYRSMTISNNLFMDRNQSLIGGLISFQGNHFPIIKANDPVMLLLGNRITFTGNLAEDNSALLKYTADTGGVADTGNLLTLQGF